jgi:hypothetical protein
MKKLILSLAILFIGLNITISNAHDLNYGNITPHHWQLNSKQSIDGTFYFYKNGIVTIETPTNQTVKISFAQLAKNDQEYVQMRQAKIDALNKQTIHNLTIRNENNPASSDNWKLPFLFALLVTFAAFVFTQRIKTHFKILASLFSASLLITLVSFSLKSASSTSPATINAAFNPFVPYVHTFYDSTYFWVESQGIPTTHTMMVGIASNGWQRQVPIPQCYMGTNAWPIPLNPVMATNPIPVDSIHFTRGAIAIAVNGVPIFNEHTNTGADALTAGQLDTYGGHCGRGDDYHYHIAPLHLYNHTDAKLPIAYALDGYAVYGSKEADGSNMQTLDGNHGHAYGGTYHYHGTTTYPYMIAKMAGQVTEDATHQLIPQAVAHPVRAGQFPLNGALLTGCVPNATNNGYTVIYTYKNNTDSVVYSWDANGNYTFNYYTAGNIDSTETKHGFVQCVVPATPLGINSVNSKSSLHIYPNPSSDNLFIESNISIQQIEVYSNNGVLELTKHIDTNTNNLSISTASFVNGIHFLRIIDKAGNTSTQKFVKE